MAQNENQAAAQQPGDLEVRVARELLERARAEGVSLVALWAAAPRRAEFPCRRNRHFTASL